MTRTHLSQAAIAPTSALKGRVLVGIILVTGAYCVIGSIITLLGWILDYPPLTDWLSQGISMFVNTAVCAIMGGAALMLLAFGGGRQWTVLASRILAFLMAVIGAATLFEHVTAVDLGIDRLLIERSWGQRASTSPMRMGPPACTAFLILGAALLLAGGGARSRRMASLLAMLTVGITSLSLVGYLFGTGRLFGIAKLTGIAWQSSTILAAMGVGVIAVVPEHGMAALLRRRDAGGVVARRLLLPIIGVPLFFGWLEVQGQQLKYYDAAFGTAILVLATITMLVLMLCWAAEGLSRQEQLTQAAREAERQTEARLASILEQIPLGVGVSDLQGNWILSNPVIREYVPDTIPARDPARRQRWSSLTPEGEALPPDQWPAERALRGESVSPGLEMCYQNDEGKTIWLRVAAVPLRNERGEVAGAIAVIEDIDEIKRAEMALRVSEERFTRFMQSLPGLAWIKDLRGRYVFASDSAIKAFNRTREELYGRRDDEVFPPETAAQFMENDTRALSTPEGLQTIEKLVHEGGELHYSIVSKFPIPGQAGSPTLVGGIAIDITDRMRAEEALREADRRKDEFLATLAHELRNPLAPIRFGIHMFNENPPADPDQRWAVEVIDRQVQQMARLLEDLLDVSRISYSKLELRKERVELSQIIKNTVETSRPLIEAGGHQLTVTLPPEPLHLMADPARLSQIFSNLLNNAAKYTENGGQILITGVRQENLVELVVRDTGIGIAADMLPRVFEMFAQVKRGSERSQGGLGIGLSLVRGLVELHGGSVDVRSEGPNQGSEFIVRLPLSEESWTPEQLERDRGAATTARCRVLVADDLRDSADSLAILLRSMGHEVFTAYDGAEALATAEKLQPQVLLLDLGMPKLTGHEVCRKLRERPWAKNALIIAMTGWGRESDRRRTQEAGFDHHLIKPVAVSSVSQLLAASSTARARGVELEPV